MNIGKLACVSIIFATGQFVIITTLAAFIYPGGYDYFGYYFSDLGREVAINGDPNPTSSVLFTLALVTAGLFLIPLWLILLSLFKGSTLERNLSILGSLSGLLSSPLLIGVGLFPTDTQEEIHSLFAQSFFIAFGIAILIYSIAIMISQDYSNYFSLLGIIVFILAIISVFALVGEDLTPLAQKIAVYSYILWSFVQVFTLWPTFKDETWPST